MPSLTPPRSTYRARLRARAHVLLRKREVPRSADGRPGVRLPPPDGITLLRAAICLSIVITHLQPIPAAGFPLLFPFEPTKAWLATHLRLGFESFFMLAGYFLAHNFRTTPGQTVSVLGFYRRRVVRLLPPYWLILIVSWVVWEVTAVRRHEAVPWFPSGFWRQMFLLPNLEVGDLAAPQLWFMASLFQFYLVWGTVFWLVRKAQGGRGVEDSHRDTIRAMMALTALTFLVSIGLDDHFGGLGYTLPTNAHYLALGCLIYWCGNGGVGLAWLPCALGLEVAHGCMTNQSRPIATVVTGFLLVWGADRVFAAGPKLAWAMVIGRCSYSIYLTHLFVGWRVMALFALLVSRRIDLWGEDALGWMVAVVGCVLFGYGYHRLVERPCTEWARTIGYRSRANTPPDQAAPESGGTTDPGRFLEGTARSAAGKTLA